MKNKKSSKKRKLKIFKALRRFFTTIYKFIDKIIITPISKFMLMISNLLKKNNLPIDRLLNNKLVLITLSLGLALVAFFFIDATTNTISNSADVIYGQKVTALYNEESYVIEGLPDTVDITLIGRKSDLYLAKQYPNDEVVVDLRDLKAGTHEISLKYKGAISSVDYKLDPSTATIVIYEKMSVTKTINKEILNADKLEAKYSIANITYDRDEVYVKGAQYKLDQIAEVKALIDVSKIKNQQTGTVTLKEIPLVAYDSNGDKLDLEIVPATINAQIELVSTNKEVPFKIIPEGIENLIKSGKAIDSISLSETKTAIYGNSEDIKDILSVPVKLDVSNLTQNTSVTINVSKPSGVKELGVKTLTAKITLGDAKKKTVDNVSIETKNLSEGLVAQAATQEDSSVSVIVTGTKNTIDSVLSENIKASVDLKDLGVGAHDVQVTVTGDDSKLYYEPRTKTVKIIIKKA